MVQYIPKSALVAEIENQRKHYIEREDFDIGWNMALDKILSFLDTLEVKEVDLDAEVEDYIENTSFITYDLEDCDIKMTAKYFFELGLKAQKGE